MIKINVYKILRVSGLWNVYEIYDGLCIIRGVEVTMKVEEKNVGPMPEPREPSGVLDFSVQEMCTHLEGASLTPNKSAPLPLSDPVHAQLAFTILRGVQHGGVQHGHS